MAVIKYKDSAGNWKDLIYAEGGEGGGGETLDLGTFYREAFENDTDVTNLITYKPRQNDLCYNAPRRKIISLYEDTSGVSDMETFYFDTQHWDLYYKTVTMKFVCSNAVGNPEVLTLTYNYSEDGETVTSIFARIDIDDRVGDIETALDNIIAIQNTLIGGDGV